LSITCEGQLCNLPPTLDPIKDKGGITQHKLNADAAIQVMMKHLGPRSPNSKHHEQPTVLRLGYFITVLALILLSNAQFTTDVFPDLYEASVQDLQHGMDAGHFTSVDLVEVGSTDRATLAIHDRRTDRQAYFARIDEVNFQGPVLRAVLELNPFALSQASSLDYERKIKGKRGPLHGIPILVKARRIPSNCCIVV